MGRPSRRPRSIIAALLVVSLVSLVGTTTVVARDPAVRTNADVVLRSTGDDSFIDRPARSVDVRAIGDSTASTPDERVTMAADVGTAFEGLGRDDGPATYSGTVGVAVGPEHVVQIDGDRIRMTDRTGNQRLLISNKSFFGLDGPDIVDTEVGRMDLLYDSLHGRWLVLQASYDCETSTGATLGRGWLDLAVSRTADPTKSWDVISIGRRDQAPVPLSLGTSSDKVVMYGDWAPLGEDLGGSLSCAPGAAQEQRFIAFDWIQLTRWDDTIYYAPFATDLVDGMHPAVQEPATTATLFLPGLRFINDGFERAYHLQYQVLTGSVQAGTADLSDWVDLTNQGVVDPMPEPSVADQPGNPDSLSVGYGIQAAKWQAGRLVLALARGCGEEFTPEWRPCIRVEELSTTTATPTSTQTIEIDEVGISNFNPALALTGRGDIALTWHRSSAAAGDYVSVVAAHQHRGDDPGTLSDPQEIAAGSAVRLVGNLIDRHLVAPDPQVPDAAWSGLIRPTGDWAYRSRVTQLRLHPGATYVPIAPVRVLDSRTPLGVSGGFISGTPRTFVVGGFSSPAGTIPADAIAVTGNLTVTGQSSAGYVSVTTTATSTPRSSTINFPRGDTRANNVTVPLSPTGRLAAVYKATGGASTHLIFDVTGYFLPGTEDAGYATMTPTRFLDSRHGIAVGLSGRFTSGIPRKLDVAGTKGVPPDAVAVTANLTVVNQTRGGYVSVTTSNEPSPSSSTINVPAGDVRANGLTAKLQGGDLWLVYKSSAGATTDLLLDITGYYRAAGDGMAFYPLDPGRIMDTRSTILTGLSGPFVASTPRKLLTDRHWGVPSGARAITGNLTVVGQTGAGYVSATPTAQASPTTSTINVPLGDVRANGITVPLDGDGDQHFVFKSSVGRTTHLILDVTGYFR